MPIFSAESKNKKLILSSAGIFSAIALFFAVRILFFPANQGAADLSPVQSPDIANAENVKITKINSDLFSSEEFKNFQEYPVKIAAIAAIKKGNSNPFAEQNKKNEKIKIDNDAADKLFAEFTASFGVDLNEDEKSKCLDGITELKLANDKYREAIKACFTDKRNKILGR